MSAVTVALTKDNFKIQALQSKTPILVDFWAQWCAPCRAVAPILDELAARYQGKFTIGKVNVDEHPDLAAQYGVLNIPTLIIFQNGEEVDRLVGVQPKSQLEAKIKKLAG